LIVAGGGEPCHLIDEPGLDHVIHPPIDGREELVAGKVEDEDERAERWGLGWSVRVPPREGPAGEKGELEGAQEPLPAASRPQPVGGGSIERREPAQQLIGRELAQKGGERAASFGIERGFLEDRVGERSEEEARA